MKKTEIFVFGLYIMFIISLFFISGCSQDYEEQKSDFQKTNLNRDQKIGGGYPEPQFYDRGNQTNLTDEERAEMFSEMNQRAIEVCFYKTEYDSCELETPRGLIDGECQYAGEDLVCFFDTPSDRPRSTDEPR